MRLTASIGSCLALALALGACQDPVTEPAAAPDLGSAQFALQSSTADYGLDRGSIAPPSGRITDQHLPELAARAIDPDDYVCPASTDVVDWWLDAAYDIIDNEPALFDLIYNQLLADLIPTYDALYFETDANEQYFGYNGEYTHVLQKTHRDTKLFWDIESSDIQLIGMHGSMLLDVERSAQTYAFLFGLPPASATFYATLARDALLQSQTMNGGNHPLFSFNAFAASFGGPYPDKIVMGDGIMAGYEALGFGDIAPQAIYAHEFAHHIQFENGYFNNRPGDTAADATATKSGDNDIGIRSTG